jgi:hypothetical protein
MNFVNFDELQKEREDKFKAQLEEEKRELPECLCGGKLERNKLFGGYYCTKCGVLYDDVFVPIYLDEDKTESDNMINYDAFAEERKLAVFDVKNLFNLKKSQIINVVSVRDSKYDRLYDEWTKVAKSDKKSDKKAQFFEKRLRMEREENNKLRSKIANIYSELEKRRLSYNEKIKKIKELKE